jgi:hypothetical protein
MTKRTTPYSIKYNKFDVNNLKTEERLSRINFISKVVAAGRLKKGRPPVLKKQDCNNNKENRNSNLSSFSLSLGGMDSIVNSYPDNDEKFEGSPPPNFSKFGLLQSTSKQHDSKNIPNSTEGQTVSINKTVSDNTNFADNFNFDFNSDDSDNEDKNKKIDRNNNDPEAEPVLVQF